VFEAGKISGTARADETLLRHIFTNVLGNAVKYSAAGSEVRFSAERAGTDAVFLVRDRGIGIPDEDAAQLFTSFHRGSNVGEVPGSGLGLGIVKRCVDLLGGTIDVRSKLDEGTEVTVRLPLFGPGPAGRRYAAGSKEKAKPRRAAAGASSHRRGKNRKVP
jgi:signal transduction histidine kinase